MKAASKIFLPTLSICRRSVVLCSEGTVICIIFIIINYDNYLQEKCSIVFRGDTRDVLILRLTHLALHGPNCSSSLSLSVQVVIDDHGGFGSHNQSSLLSSMIKVIINDQSYPQRSKQPSLLSCLPCPTCKYLLEVSPQFEEAT